LDILGDEEKEKLKILATIRSNDGIFDNSKILQFVEECCDIFDIVVILEHISLKKEEGHFDPLSNPFYLNYKKK